MFSEVFADILKLIQILLLPALGLMYMALKKQINNQRDMKEMKKYLIIVCKKLNVECTLESN